MSDSKKSPEASAGDSVSVTIGDHARQVAAGKNVVQTLDQRADSASGASAPSPAKHGSKIAVGFILAAVLALATNLLASYLEQELQVLSTELRWSVVVGVFLGSLALSIWMAGRD